MKTYILIIFFSLFASISWGQIVIKDSSIDSGGGRSSNGAITVIQTVGEIAVQEKMTGNLTISEGFIHPDFIGITTGKIKVDVFTGVSIYPNPCSEFFVTQFADNKSYQIILLDLNGKIIKMEESVGEMNHTTNVSTLVPGNFWILVKDKLTGSYFTRKFIKM